ncbi:MAG: deoxyuridine 5'-triphosphate nucleotidohydrolase [Lachnospiraceae bacterium]
MQRVAQYFKVSEENFIQALRDDFPQYSETEAKKIYESVKLPQRATKGSAGYDFYAPFSFRLAPGETIKIPTGIRAKMEEGWVLQLFPRSGLGFKFRLQLNNTVGIIDSDYFDSDNEGHIFAKITNDSNEGRILEVPEGTGFLQGIFLPYGITVDDACDGIRNGGFGSTTAKQ